MAWIGMAHLAGLGGTEHVAWSHEGQCFHKCGGRGANQRGQGEVGGGPVGQKLGEQVGL